MFTREMDVKDIEQVASLCEQFGYPAKVEEVTERFNRIRKSREHAVFVTEDESAVIGWVHVHGIQSLSSAPYAEVRGIVVDQQRRRQGVGQFLMTQAEQWALENNYQVVRLRSGTERPESHQFYPRLGYTQTKTQHHYQKLLAQS